MTDRILVPFDGSPPSRDALEYAFDTYPDAEITALYVVPTPESYFAAFEGADVEKLVDHGQEHGEELLAEATAIAEDHGRDLETELTTGEPHHVIVDEATDGGYDAVVMGSHGREGLSRVILGSVAERVVRRSPIPVVVVR